MRAETAIENAECGMLNWGFDSLGFDAVAEGG
jgi:hypothetical protein